jgi:hypothetical protein
VFLVTELLWNGTEATYRVSCIVYSNGNFFESIDLAQPSSVVNSLVMSGAVNGIQIANLTDPIKIVFRLKQVSGETWLIVPVVTCKFLTAIHSAYRLTVIMEQQLFGIQL